MPLEAGETVFSGDVQESRPHPDGVSAGDAVALTNGTTEQADTEANDLGGIAGEGDTVVLSGLVVANVAAGVTEGARLNAGNATDGTVGALDADAAGPAVALSAEGGTWHGAAGTYDVPDGYAVVYL